MQTALHRPGGLRHDYATLPLGSQGRNFNRLDFLPHPFGQWACINLCVLQLVRQCGINALLDQFSIESFFSIRAVRNIFFHLRFLRNGLE
jgi:hypothetical protein